MVKGTMLIHYCSVNICLLPVSCVRLLPRPLFCPAVSACPKSKETWGIFLVGFNNTFVSICYGTPARRFQFPFIITMDQLLLLLLLALTFTYNQSFRGFIVFRRPFPLGSRSGNNNDLPQILLFLWSLRVSRLSCTPRSIIYWFVETTFTKVGCRLCKGQASAQAR